jgi:hypothetical protein
MNARRLPIGGLLGAAIAHPAVALATPPDDHAGGTAADPAELAAANLAGAAFQDVPAAEAAGYATTMDALGCFEDAERGGMGLQYLNDALMDAALDIAAPEALVYELDHTGEITSLVAHEYIVSGNG